MGDINNNRTGLTLGIFFAIWHAIWAILVAIGVAEQLLNWALPLHFVSASFTIASFSITSAIMIVVASFIGGYVAGWVFALIWNWVEKKF